MIRITRALHPLNFKLSFCLTENLNATHMWKRQFCTAIDQINLSLPVSCVKLIQSRLFDSPDFWWDVDLIKINTVFVKWSDLLFLLQIFDDWRWKLIGFDGGCCEWYN